jgi:hypothetical protein
MCPIGATYLYPALTSMNQHYTNQNKRIGPVQGGHHQHLVAGNLFLL